MLAWLGSIFTWFRAEVVWTLPILTWIAAIVVMYASKPERRKLAHLSALFIFFLAIWQGYTSYQDWRTRQTVEKNVYSRIAKATYKSIGLVHQMVRQSSDAWVPYTEEELLSERTAILVCRYLNINAPAPIVPERSWLIYIYEETRETKGELPSVLDSYASSLDEELLQAVINFRQSFMLVNPGTQIGVHQAGVQRGVRYPPLLCLSLEMVMQESLGELRHLDEVIRKRAGLHSWFTTWPPNTPQPTQEPGPARFSDQDLQRWEAEHPTPIREKSLEQR